YGLAWNVADAVERDILWYDLDGDGVVGHLDSVVILDNYIRFREQKEDYLIGDLNTSGTIDINDVEILLEQRDLQADWYGEPADAGDSIARFTKTSDLPAKPSL
ncbi:MAG: hypothetical protein ACYS8Z_15180, partial [Planctomycetota bacterium]